MRLWLVFIKHCTKHLTSIKSFNPSRQSFEVNHTCNLQTRKPKLRDQVNHLKTPSEVVAETELEPQAV